jgi:hypothetical protein
MEELTCVGRHLFDRAMAAFGAGQLGLKFHSKPSLKRIEYAVSQLFAPA